jgi:hypothetical protein
MSSTSEQVGVLIEEQNAAALKLWSNIEFFRNHQRIPDTSLPPGLLDSLVEFSRTADQNRA